MKDGAEEILARTIAKVIIKEARDMARPRSLLLLGFTDGTWFEFYSNGDISPTGGVDRTSLENYMNATHETVFYADGKASG